VKWLTNLSTMNEIRSLLTFFRLRCSDPSWLLKKLLSDGGCVSCDLSDDGGDAGCARGRSLHRHHLISGPNAFIM